MITPELNKISIRKNDQVEVMTGDDAGKRGKVLSVNTKTGYLKVEKLKLVKRHVKPSQKNPQGGILEKEAPIHYSNVLLLCAKCNRGVRHGYKWVSQGGAKKGKGAKSAPESSEKQVKVRVCKRCGETLESA